MATSRSIEPLSLQDMALAWLDHLEAKGQKDDSRASQPGIAAAIGRSRSQISRVVSELTATGLVRETTTRFPGFRRAVTAYELSSAGKERVAQLIQKLKQGAVGGAEASQASLWENLREKIVQETPVVVPVRIVGAVRFLQEMSDAPPARDFVGRAGELHQFRDWLAGNGSVWTVDGPAGVGKTSLVAHAVRAASGRHVLWVRATERSGPTLLLERLDRLLRNAGRPGPPLVPREPQEMLGEIRPRVAGLPFLIVIDDFHKADAALRRAVDVLAAIAETEKQLKIVLVGRQVLTPPEAGRTARVHQLKPLSDEDAVNLLHTLKVSHDRHAAILAAARGNALFLVLMAHSSTTAAPNAGIARYLVLDIGTTLSAEQQKVVRYACALRLPTSPQLFERVQAGSPAMLDELVHAGLLTRVADGRIDMHDLARDAFYEQLTFAERRTIHEHLAKAFQPREADWSDMAEFLHHLVLAGRRDEAAGWVMRHRNQILAWIHDRGASR